MKKIFPLLLVFLMILALAACGSPAPTVSGVWTVSSFPDLYSDADSVSVTLELGEDGKGYSLFTEDSNKTYSPVSWTDTKITINGKTASYVWEGDSLTLNADEGTYILTRTGSAEKRTALKPGTYTLVRGIVNGEDRTEEISATVVTVNADGTGTSRNGDYSADFTWDAYFFTFPADGNQYYYTFDGSTLTEYQGRTQLNFLLGD